MTSLSTTVLFHEGGPQPDHYDWLFEDPDGGEKLVCFRVDRPPGRWRSGERIRLDALAPHRPCYLTYEGPLSGGRGTVQLIERGRLHVQRWEWDRAEMRMQTEAFSGRVVLTGGGGGKWTMEVVEASA
ncbi:MAG: hypothetical protein R3236_01780 [Phycisphaeraceae bacterium]|nr:hypothetical protein [Phycisphaeraceae bacterium]